jgi:hypothetical protein
MTAEESNRQIREFIDERNKAFLSLDEKTIRDFHLKWNQREMPADMNVFWGSVHKAITGVRTLPIEFRRSSKKWLSERGLSSFDDGDL